MNKIINDWSVKTLEECCDILDNRRVPINSEEREKRPGEIPYYGANGLQGYIDGFIFDEPLILIAEDGGQFNEFATRPIAYRIEGKSWVNNHAHVLRAKKEYVQNAIFYALEHKDIQQYIVGGTRSKLNQSALRKISILIPNNKNEQNKIAEILETVDRSINQTEALIAKQERLKTGLMQDLLTKGIDEHGNIRSEDTHEFKDSLLGKIPVEWDVKRLDSISLKIADRDHTTPTYVEDGVLIISPMAFYDEEGIDFKKCPMITQKAHEVNRKKTDCMPGDLILHRIGAGLGRVRLVLNSHPKYSILHSLCMIRVNNELVSNSYLKWAFRSYELQKQISLGTQSIGVPDLGLDKIASLLFKIPLDIGEQKRIERILEENQRHTDDYLRQLRKLCSLKTGLMQDLLTGKKRVTPLLSETEVIS